MQSVDHYSLPTATDSERLLSNITSPSDDPLTEIASADELQPTITEVDGPIPRFVPIDQSMVLPRVDSQETHFLTEIEQPDTSRQESGEGTLTNCTANSPPPLNPVPGSNKRNDNKKACLKQLTQTQKPQKQDPGPHLLPPLSRLPPTAGLPYYHEQSYPSLVQMSHPSEPHPSSNSLNPQTNPLLVHVPPGGYQLTRPVLEDHLSFQQCPCYLTHGFIPHSAPPYQQVYVPLQPGSAPYAPLSGTGQDTLVYPDMYTGPRQTLIPTQSYPNMDHIFPYDPSYQRPSIFIPYAVQEALTTLQPPVSGPGGKSKTHRTSKKEALRKRDLETGTKPSEDLSMIKKSKVDPAPQPVPGELLLQQAPHPNMSTAPHYRTDNILPCISANFNPFYSQFVPAANNFYQQGHIPYYQQQQIEPEKRQPSRRALFQFQGAPPSEDSLGVQPLEKTPQTKMSPTSTSMTTPEVDTSSASQLSKNSDHPCGIVQQNSGNNTLLRQNRANIPPPISLPPHINNFVNSDTIS